jgi:hypothetical protein
MPSMLYSFAISSFLCPAPVIALRTFIAGQKRNIGTYPALLPPVAVMMNK